MLSDKSVPHAHDTQQLQYVERHRDSNIKLHERHDKLMIFITYDIVWWQQSSQTQSWLLGLVEVGGDAVLAHNVNHCSPTRKHVPIAGSCYYLVKLRLQLLTLHSLAVVSLANSHQLLTTRTRALEPLNHALSSNRVVTCQHRLAVVDACNDGLNDPAAESEWSGVYLFSKRE